MESIKLAEMFLSIQGEGVNAGTPMLFIRFPYCNIQEKYGICETFDGRRFKCDTSLASAKEYSLEQIKEQLDYPHICFTGGEPFAEANLDALNLIWNEISHARSAIYFETNGTCTIPIRFAHLAYISCSPKKGFIFANSVYVDEFRFLVDGNFEPENLEKFEQFGKPIFLSPIFDMASPSDNNIRRAVDLVKTHPRWRLNLQMHKLWNIR